MSHLRSMRGMPRHCLVLWCLRGMKYLGFTHPSDLCMFRSICPQSTSYQKIRLPRLRDASKYKPQPRFDCPSFVPMISLGDEASCFWGSMSHNALIVSLGEMLSTNTLVKRIKAEGIHDFLGFQGRILLSPLCLMSSLIP